MLTCMGQRLIASKLCLTMSNNESDRYDQMTKRQSETLQASSFFERIASGEDPFLSQLDRNAKTLLQSALTRLDVVSREEFDAQAAVLKRTRERLEILEAQIEALTIELESAPNKGD